MKLQVRKFGQLLVLTDETGEMLPGQVKTTYQSDAKELPTVTVTFFISAPDIELVEGEAIPTRYER